MESVIKKITQKSHDRKHVGNYKYVESPKVDKFLVDILKVCERHGMSLSHEDCHGGFEVVNFDKSCASWLWAAMDKRND